MKQSNESRIKSADSDETVVLPTREEEDKASADLSATSDKTQIVQASSNSSIAGSAVSFPPGSVAIDTEITISPGENLAGNLSAQGLDLGTDLTSSANAVSITSSVPMDTTQPFTIALPIPDGSGLHLADPYANLVVLYKVDKNSLGSSFSGLIPRKSIDIKDGYAHILTTHFGTFQTAFTKAVVSEAIEAVVEKTVAEEPVKVEPTPIKTRYYYSKGMLPASFGEDRSRINGYQGWIHRYSKAKVGTDTTLETGKLTGIKVGE